MDDVLTMILFFAAILIFGGLLFVVIALTKKGPKQLDVDYYRRKWLEIEQKLRREDDGSIHLAVMNADKLLDKALQDRGVVATNMGDRMKKLQTTWSDANAVWTAHKLRNRITHDTDVRVEYSQARQALAAFKQALKDVGAI